MGKVRLFTYLSIVFILTLWYSGVSAFEVCKTLTTNAEIKWSGTNPDVTYKINTSGGPDGSLSAIQTAIQTWTDVRAAGLAFVYGGATAKTGANHAVNDGENIVTFEAMGQNGTLAENAYWFYSSGAMIDSDIQFNTSYSWSTNLAQNTYDVQNVGTHEFGHSLCLKDLYNGADSDKTMYGYASQGETKKRTPHQDDIDGIIYLYPAPYVTATPASVGFGSLPVGSSSNQTVTVTNGGPTNLNIGMISNPSSPFSIVTDDCSGATIAPSTGSCTVTVKFAPASSGGFGGNFNIPSNDPDEDLSTVGLSGTGIRQYTLTVNKDGTGTGTVTSSPAGINCGSDCTELYNEGAVVTLTASPGVNSTFAGWSGGGCSGTGSCSVTMNADTAVTTTFNSVPLPIADFSASPPSGNVPLTVTFTDLSANGPTSWSWDFDNDGIVDSTLQNPTFIYQQEGTYTVTLTISNSGGSDSETKIGYITVNPCSNPKVRIEGEMNSYLSLQAAYNNASEGDTIQSQAMDFSEDLTFDSNVSVNLKGGFNCTYTANGTHTIVVGTMTIAGGTVVIDHIALQ